MPAGCDFVCKNEKCDCCETGFTMTGPWPMGDIGEVIDSLSSEERIKELMKLKKEGREFACIAYPNDKDIYIDRYRINFWSVEGNCIWQYDIVVEDDIESAILDSDIPKLCPKTGSELLNYNDTIQQGINCPHCKEKLKQTRWFSIEE